MRILIACEHSGTVREAFRALGHDAWSCDLLPASDGSPHHMQCDVIDVLLTQNLRMIRHSWQLLIAHPPCTYLTNSAAWAFKDPDYERYPGVGYHQKVGPETLTGAARRAAREEAVAFSKELWNCGIERICIENPVGELSNHLGKAQTVQPYHFGDDASKGTGLWRRGLPPLTINPAARFQGRWVTWEGKQMERWSNQTDGGQNKLTPTKKRAHDRAITYPGIARAMARQWGSITYALDPIAPDAGCDAPKEPKAP